MSDVTIITAFVDIGRGEWVGVKNNQPIPPYIKRDTETYLARFERLTKLKNKIICFTESKFFDRIIAMRDDIELIGIDSIWNDHQHLLNKIKNIQQESSFINFVTRPSAPEYWSPEYVAINLMKSHFVTYAISQNLVTTKNAAWIDFGYCRPEVYCPESTTWEYSTDDKINLFSHNLAKLNIPIFELIRTGEVVFQGCHITAPIKLWSTLKQLVNDNLTTLFNVGLIDDDQTLLLMSYRSAPELFKIIPADSNNWFTIFEGRCK